MSTLIEKLDTDITRLTDTLESLEATLKKMDSQKSKDGSVVRLIKDKANCEKLLNKLRREREIENEKQTRGHHDTGEDEWCAYESRNKLYNALRSHYIKEENS